ncbi:unnamed protein product [Trichogramma brassicae]|uniref:Uncharacterized protein n=1 Tax=Trichogramma brassicae TaxID=86971 RepID=A0A6H5IMG9_9HYME|nr:unnamed protein product [Trichogramma brassicae]
MTSKRLGCCCLMHTIIYIYMTTRDSGAVSTCHCIRSVEAILSCIRESVRRRAGTTTTDTCTDRPTEVSVIRFVSRNHTIEEIAPKKPIFSRKLKITEALAARKRRSKHEKKRTRSRAMIKARANKRRRRRRRSASSQIRYFTACDSRIIARFFRLERLPRAAAEQQRVRRVPPSKCILMQARRGSSSFFFARSDPEERERELLSTYYIVERMWLACSPKFPPAPPHFFQKCEFHVIFA